MNGLGKILAKKKGKEMCLKTVKRERDKLVSLSYFNPELHKDLQFALLDLTVMSKSFMTSRPPNISYRSN